MPRWTLVAVTVLISAGPSVAQEPAGSIAVGVGLARAFSDVGLLWSTKSHSWEEPRPACPFADCRGVVKSFAMEGAFNITNRVALVGGVEFAFGNLNTVIRNGSSLEWRNRDAGWPVEGIATTVSWRGGLRGFVNQGRERVFVEVLVDRLSGAVTTLFGDRGDSGARSVSGTLISPGGGVDIPVAERVNVRFSARMLLGRATSDRSLWGVWGPDGIGTAFTSSIDVGIGLAFEFGGTLGKEIVRR